MDEPEVYGVHDVDSLQVWYAVRGQRHVAIHFEFIEQVKQEPITVTITKKDAILLRNKLEALLEALDTLSTFERPLGQ